MRATLIKEACGVDPKEKQREAARRPRRSKDEKDARRRRRRIQCKKRKFVVECRSCNVALCIGDRDCAEKSCWQLRHEAKGV